MPHNIDNPICLYKLRLHVNISQTRTVTGTVIVSKVTSIRPIESGALYLEKKRIEMADNETEIHPVNIVLFSITCFYTFHILHELFKNIPTRSRYMDFANIF